MSSILRIGWEFGTGPEVRGAFDRGSCDCFDAKLDIGAIGRGGNGGWALESPRRGGKGRASIRVLPMVMYEPVLSNAYAGVPTRSRAECFATRTKVWRRRKNVESEESTQAGFGPNMHCGIVADCRRGPIMLGARLCYAMAGLDF
jgi:hypothetical protein